jgi:solute carrier family 35 protein F1/2
MSNWRILLFGQFLSVLLTVQSICTQALAERGVMIAAAQSWGNYFLLSFLFLRRKRPRNGPFLRVKWYYYALLALLDVEGNFLIVKGYDEGATITSAMLLDSFVIPQVMILSYYVLHHHYYTSHCAGVTLCLIGLVVLVFADYRAAMGAAGLSSPTNSTAAATTSDASPKSTLTGDLLVTISTVFYACSNVGQETMVKKFDKWEFLGMLGIFGFIITTVQLLLLDYFVDYHSTHLAHVDWADPTIIMLLATFVGSLFAFYVSTALFLESADATLFNLSLLTSDVRTA